nr:type IV secretory system conjugative DNA transfer family protein [Acidithiobacillus sp.]
IVRSIEQLSASSRPAVVRKLGDLQQRAMRKEALSLGAQAGLYVEGKKLDDWLLTRAPQLDKTYDFRRLVYPASLHVQGRLTGTSLLPPIVEFSHDFTRLEGPDTLHVSRSFYRITNQARFSTVVPNWREYLIQGWSKPDVQSVPRVLLPENAKERKTWIAAVQRGFVLGKAQAITNFHTSLARLQRDFLGMVLYRKLEMQGKIGAPVLAHANEGNVVSAQGRDLRIHSEDLRITRLPAWHPNQYWSGTPWKSPEYRTRADLKGHPEKSEAQQ